MYLFKNGYETLQVGGFELWHFEVGAVIDCYVNVLYKDMQLLICLQRYYIALSEFKN